ncbi:MAG TPA: phage tail tape measure protein [Verrucomicrobiae bacterium]
MGAQLLEKLTFEVELPRTTGGFKGLLEELRAIDTALASLQMRFSGLSQPGFFRKSARQIEKELKAFQQTISKSSPQDIGKYLGFDDQTLKNFFGKAEVARAGYFKNSRAAAGEFAKLSKEASKNADVTAQAFASFLNGGTGRVAGQIPVAAVAEIKTAQVNGIVPLIVPASQVKAVLEGAVTLTIPASAVQGVAKGGTAGAAASGAGVTATGGKVPKAGKSNSPSAAEIERFTTTNKKGTTTAITKALNPFDTETVVTNPKGGETVIRRQQRGKELVQGVNDRLAETRSRMGQEMDSGFTGRRSADLKRRADLLTKAAADVEAILNDSKKDLEAIKQKRVVRQLENRVGSLKAQAAKAQEQSAQAALAEATTAAKAMAPVYRAGERTRKQIEKDRLKTEAADEKAKEALRNQQNTVLHGATSQALMDGALTYGYTQKSQTQRTRVSNKGNPINVVSTVMEKEEGGKKLTKTLVQEYDQAGKLLKTSLTDTTKALKDVHDSASAAGRGFVQNTANVTLWAASVATLYGSLNLLKTSLSSVIDIGLQTARLDQVFQGVGGSARQLRDDVLRLAAAEGRSSEEAIQSAISWSRLGLTRAQVNEAVRVSLIAANVAELDAAEATNRLQAIYMAYGLTVGQLAGVLGQLNEVSNTFNVTNRDLLDGISKTVGVAKQAGLGLSELIGIVGATAGSTGQSGANIGNAVKSIITQLSNPDIQKFLRHEFKLETTESGGSELKNMSKVLADLFVSYQKMTDIERQWLLVKVAGRHQSSRMASMLDSYIRAQTLAINAQLNLNSAEEENAKIKSTLAAQLKNISTEWDRLISKQGENGAVRMMSEMAQAFSNVLSVLNSDFGSKALTAIAVLLAVITARLILTAVNMMRAGTATGYMATTARQLAGAYQQLNAVMDLTIARLHASPGLWGRMKASALSAIGAIKGAFLFMWKSLQVALVGFITMLPQMAVFAAGLWAWNRGMDAIGRSSEAAERKLAGFNAEAERAASAAAAAAQAARLYDTAQRALPAMRSEKEQIRLVKQLGDVGLSKSDQIKVMDSLRSGDTPAANAVLEKERVEWIERAVEERQKEYEAIQKNIQLAEEEVDRLRGSFLPDANLIKEWESRLEEMRNKGVKAALDISRGLDDSLEQYHANDAQSQANLERHKMILQGIAEIYREIGSMTPMGKHMLDVQSLESQVGYLERLAPKLESQRAGLIEDLQRKRREQNNKEAEEKRNEAMRIREEGMRVPYGMPAYMSQRISQLEREAFNLEAPTNRGIAGNAGYQQLLKLQRQVEDDLKAKRTELEGVKAQEEQARQRTRLNLATQGAKAEASQFDVGDNEAEKLRAREAGLRRLIQQKEKTFEAMRPIEEQERNIAGLLQHQLDLQELLIEKERMKHQLTRDEAQFLKERNKEAQRALAMAGPEDMLRRLGASQLVRGGMDAGKWFSLDPKMRETIQQMFPQFSFEFREMRKARQALGGPKPAGELEKDIDALDKDRRRWLGRLKPKDGDPAPNLPDETNRLALEFRNLGKGVSAFAETVSNAVAKIDAAIAGMKPGGGGGLNRPRQAMGGVVG